MYFEEEIKLPALVAIKTFKKKKADEGQNLSMQEAANTIAQEFMKYQNDKDKKPEKQEKIKIDKDDIDELDKKFNHLHEKIGKKPQKEEKRVNNSKEQENQKSKFMITEMMKKINAKNISEELSPVTTESIFNFIKNLDQQISVLKLQAERKEISINANPNNQLLKKELETLRVSIDRCVKIKELYNEKLNLRHKVSILEKNILSLQEQNQNLKIQMTRKVEDSENHAMGLPCEKQKELKDELAKCQIIIKKQKGIRQQLQGNITQIVQTFKRLYEEADAARLIVTKKLVEIQQKQKQWENHQPQASEKASSSAQKKHTSQSQIIEERKFRAQQTASQNQDTSNINTARPLKRPVQERRDWTEQTAAKFNNEKTVTKVKVQSQLEQAIRKMRGNQIMSTRREK